MRGNDENQLSVLQRITWIPAYAGMTETGDGSQASRPDKAHHAASGMSDPSRMRFAYPAYPTEPYSS